MVKAVPYIGLIRIGDSSSTSQEKMAKIENLNLSDFEDDFLVEFEDSLDKVLVDKPDELEENDCLQHMRDVYEIEESDSDDEFDEIKDKDDPPQTSKDSNYTSPFIFGHEIATLQNVGILFLKF